MPPPQIAILRTIAVKVGGMVEVGVWGINYPATPAVNQDATEFNENLQVYMLLYA